jgi:hypothetical protein
MFLKHCQDCKYQPDNLVFSDTCKKKILEYDTEEVYINIRESNKDNNCRFYKPDFIKIIKLFINKLSTGKI